MKKTVVILFFIFFIIANAADLDDVANKELEYSKHFLHLEVIQQVYLDRYVRLLKARYLLSKQMPWASNNILNAIDLKSRMIYLRNNYEK